MLVTDIQEEIIQDFAPYTESIDKYKELIKLAKNHQSIPKELKIPENAVKGCQSTVWIAINYSDGKMVMQGDTDVMITKGILTLLLRVLNNQTPKDILSTDLYFLERIGLKNSLSPHRANGVLAIIEHIRNEAKKYNT